MASTPRSSNPGLRADHRHGGTERSCIGAARDGARHHPDGAALKQAVSGLSDSDLKTNVKIFGREMTNRVPL
jgi:hypothetical protein